MSITNDVRAIMMAQPVDNRYADEVEARLRRLSAKDLRLARSAIAVLKDRAPRITNLFRTSGTFRAKVNELIRSADQVRARVAEDRGYRYDFDSHSVGL